MPQPATCILNPNIQGTAVESFVSKYSLSHTPFVDLISVYGCVCKQWFCAWCKSACQKTNLSSVHWCHAWHRGVVPVICVFIEKPANISTCSAHLLIESQMPVSYFYLLTKCGICMWPEHYIFRVISKCWPFEKENPDLLLDKDYTVTRLEIALLMIVSRELLGRRAVSKGAALPGGNWM